MNWLPTALNEIRELLKEQAVSVGPMSNEDRAAVIREELDRKINDVVHRLASLDEVLCALACQGENLLASNGPLIDYAALSEAAHAARWALDKVSETYELGALDQTVVVGTEQKLALFGVGEITFAVVSPTGVSLADALARTE